jgi:hypothetical protein
MEEYFFEAYLKLNIYFTYYRPETRKITNLFKLTNIGISFRSTNTIQQLTKPKLPSNTQEQEKSGLYKLRCNT